MKYIHITNNDVIRVCKCGKIMLTWQIVCSDCDNVNITNTNK